MAGLVSASGNSVHVCLPFPCSNDQNNYWFGGEL